KIDDEDLGVKLHLQLQGISKYIKANNLVQCLSDQDVQQRFGLKNTFSLATAK
ncbi:hypothetical protein PAXRUDRAFT_149182, partial [Paxillus rubicundulus Ve08.2h10]